MMQEGFSVLVCNAAQFGALFLVMSILGRVCEELSFGWMKEKSLPKIVGSFCLVLSREISASILSWHPLNH